MAAREHYERRRAEAAAEVQALSARSSAISIARVLAIVLVIAAGVATRMRSLGPMGWAATAGLFVLFLVLVLVHDRVLDRKRRAERTEAWAKEGLARVDDAWSRPVRAGDPPIDDDHPYAGDLDVFGVGSIMQSIDTTRTVEGRALLASWLRAPADADEIASRQRSARELATLDAFREELAVEGALLAKDPPDVAPLLKWAESTPTWSPGIGLQVLAVALPIVTLTVLFAGAVLPVPRWTWAASLGAQLVIAGLYRAPISAAISAASDHHDALARFASMFGIVERNTFRADDLAALHRQVIGAAARIARLGRIVGFVDARRNEVFKLFIGPLLMWDVNCALALERWRRTAGSNLRAQLASLARLEALSAFGTRAFERPDDAWPVIAPEVSFSADGLGHPLLSTKKVVRNAVTFDGPGSVLLVTGSNMSGKSTLLRAIGSNIVLALAGAPVRARELRTAVFDVRTSMRIRDSLSEGVSHFLAELQRLKGVVDAANEKRRPVIFLLDEILHGTNSRERHLGARAIVRHLVAKDACGAVSTHDLALSKLEEEIAGKVKNVHFREDVTVVDGKETMTFDYRLRPGVVTTSNALRLMRIVGIDIEIPPELPT